MKTGKIRLFRGNTATGGQYGDGCQLRDFVSVADVVRKTWEIAANMFGSGREEVLKNLATGSGTSARSISPKGACLNFGTGQARTWNDLAHALFAAMGRSPEIEYIDMPESLRAHYQNFTEAKHTMMPMLGWKSDWTSLENGVADYVRQFLSVKQT